MWVSYKEVCLQSHACLCACFAHQSTSKIQTSHRSDLLPTTGFMLIDCHLFFPYIIFAVSLCFLIELCFLFNILEEVASKPVQYSGFFFCLRCSKMAGLLVLTCAFVIPYRQLLWWVDAVWEVGKACAVLKEDFHNTVLS